MAKSILALSVYTDMLEKIIILLHVPSVAFMFKSCPLEKDV